MRLRWIAAAAALGIGCAAGASAEARPVQLPPVQHIRVGSGVRVVMMEHHRAPVIEIVAVVEGGGVRDPAGKTGVASLTAELLTRGAGARSATEMAEQIDFLGGSLEADAGDDAIHVRLSGMAADTSAWLDLLADVLRRPAFPPEELDRARKLRVAALMGLAEDPAALARRAAARVASESGPYAPMETLTSLAAITREDLAAFHAAWFVPGRITIVAVGDFSAPALAAQLRKRFETGAWADPHISDTPIAGAGARRAARVVLIDRPEAEQAHVHVVGAGPVRGASDLTAARIAATALGGGFTSRLVDEVRVRRSLTYGIGCSVHPLRMDGSFEISSFTRAATTRRMIDVIRAVTDGAGRSGLRADELRKTRAYMSGMFAIEAQTPGALAARLAGAAEYGLPDAEVTRYIERVGEVPDGAVNRAARSLFRTGGMSLVVVGPAARIRGQLKGLGPIEERTALDEVK